MTVIMSPKAGPNKRSFKAPRFDPTPRPGFEIAMGLTVSSRRQAPTGPRNIVGLKSPVGPFGAKRLIGQRPIVAASRLPSSGFQALKPQTFPRSSIGGAVECLGP